MVRNQPKSSRLAGKLELGKHVADQGTGKQGGNHIEDGHKSAVAIEAQQREFGVVEDLDVIFQGEIFRPEGGRDAQHLHVRLEGTQDHHDERQQGERQAQGQDEIDQEAA